MELHTIVPLTARLWVSTDDEVPSELRVLVGGVGVKQINVKI